MRLSKLSNDVMYKLKLFMITIPSPPNNEPLCVTAYIIDTYRSDKEVMCSLTRSSCEKWQRNCAETMDSMGPKERKVGGAGYSKTYRKLTENITHFKMF